MGDMVGQGNSSGSIWYGAGCLDSSVAWKTSSYGKANNDVAPPGVVHGSSV